jgi:hypothetical protein
LETTLFKNLCQEEKAKVRAVAGEGFVLSLWGED